jgi:5-methylcytosine-specific restriction endonuclease McrA
MTQRLRFSILKRDNHTCKACGRSAADGVALHVDHVVAVANGGKTEEDNLQILCADCNQGKGAD